MRVVPSKGFCRVFSAENSEKIVNVRVKKLNHNRIWLLYLLLKFKKMKKATTLIITLILCVQVLWAQKIQGIVFDQETKAPLWGASVSVKGSQKGNVTDAKGHFNLIVSSEAVLVVRFVGYEPVEIVAAQANQIALKKSNFLQDEVVVRDAGG